MHRADLPTAEELDERASLDAFLAIDPPPRPTAGHAGSLSALDGFDGLDGGGGGDGGGANGLDGDGAEDELPAGAAEAKATAARMAGASLPDPAVRVARARVCMRACVKQGGKTCRGCKDPTQLGFKVC